MSKFKDISTRNELADFLNLPRKKLTHILYVKKVDNLYTSFEVPKKSGGARQINAPVDELKIIQKKLADALWGYQKYIWRSKRISPNISHAFEKGKSIITNAKIHRNKRFIFNIDLENYFDSFHFGRVRGFFQKNREFQLPIEVATVIAQLTCYQGCLPQGAPSSPIITNMMCQILDNRLLKLAKEYRVDYTRYADDLTFSTNNKAFLNQWENFYEEISKEISNAGFNVNIKKTTLQFRDSRQKVTGLIVNKKINIDRRYYKATRAMAHKLYSDTTFEIDGMEGSQNQLEGRFAFINQLERYNNKIDEEKHNCWNLSSREEQYRRFLFYKYFYANDKPLIVTEGKTDISYLKSALKSLYASYPNLLSKTTTGVEFNVSFLNRTKRLEYFFGVNQEGADAMKNIYNLYTGQSGFPEYLKYFKKMCKHCPDNPVILVFDNEIYNKNKPLSKFAQHINASKEQKDGLSNNCYFKVLDNLYVLTNPLVKNKQECEIEDLFDDTTLSYELEGKTFSRDGKFDISRFYGKEIFSKHITKNYKNIDFNEFKPLLDALNEIVCTYNTT